MGGTENKTYNLKEIFKVEKLQEIQDTFSKATGVASIITEMNGNPITKGSGFCELCFTLVRGTEKGYRKCLESDASFGKSSKSVTIKKCHSAGLLDGGIRIDILGKPAGIWMIGQVVDEYMSEDEMLKYADELSIDRDLYLDALRKVKKMSRSQFEDICNYLHISANLLSELADNNILKQQEIDARKETEKKLEESNEYYKTLFTSMLNGYAVHEMFYDEKGKPVDYRFLDVNPAFEKLTGQSKGDVLGKTIMEISPEIEYFWLERYGKVQKTGEPISFEAYSKELKKYYEVYAFRPLEDRFATIFIDITEKMEVQEKIHQQQRLESIGTLAGGVAHEINNPINGIMNYGQLILDVCNPDSETTEYVTEIIRESERISLIVKSLLQFSRYDGQNHSFARMEDIINDTVNLIKTVFKSDQIDIQVDIKRDLGLIKCRSNQIQQVILNLLINARDAMNDKYPGYHEDKVIRLACRELHDSEGEWIRTIVEDMGKGIPGELQNKVFEPFFTTKERDRGTGLGLSISYGIVAAHKGRLSFETEEDKFTRFYIDLPLDNGWEPE